DLVGIAIERIISALIGGYKAVTSWQIREDHIVIARDQILEQVGASGVGDGGCHHTIVGGVMERHGYARHTAFAAILQPIDVGILPDIITQTSRCKEAKVQRQVAVAIIAIGCWLIVEIERDRQALDMAAALGNTIIIVIGIVIRVERPFVQPSGAAI